MAAGRICTGGQFGYRKLLYVKLIFYHFWFFWKRGLTLSGTKTHVKQRFLPLTPLLMVSDVLWSPVLPA
ncbi:hypothetical protein CWS33_26680 [Escherichia coli]|uniref:Uncharacterized protein n=1 Tax=Escherichia coli TaxID=562 RepID=A0AAP8LAZ9_ECOLX|nr:hypothetical protein CWS33_26680 [Escherichia coli]